MDPGTSRRERPPKPALTRDGIVTAALDLLRAEGLHRVTMRRIAAVLDTGPASLYVYVRDTADLHAQVLDALLPEPTTLPRVGPWRRRVHDILGGYAGVLRAYPELARLALSTMPSGPRYVAHVDALLGALTEGGVADGAAAWGVDVLLLYVTAQAAEKAAWADSDRLDAERSALATAVETADPSRTPHVARLAAPLLSGGKERVAWHVDVLLNGMLTTPPPQEKHP